MRFKNKVAAVTGGGSGIGKEVAKRFVAEGGKVILNGRDKTKLETAATEIDAKGTNVGIYAGDIAQPSVLAIELAHDNIRINAVAPAVVETPVYGTFLSPEEVKQILPTFNGFHPLGRNGQPEDVAEAVLFFASDQASWITGTVLPVDGGVTAGRQ
jgi:NAD(P)-dependent dehydrogenase (short-subunit alcohol dehydrogenase family)